MPPRVRDMWTSREGLPLVLLFLISPIYMDALRVSLQHIYLNKFMFLF
jgi:hypothetical protein